MEDKKDNGHPSNINLIAYNRQDKQSLSLVPLATIIHISTVVQGQ